MCAVLDMPPLLDIFPICWMWTGDEVLGKVMEEVLNMGRYKQLEQPSKVQQDWPAAWIKEALKRLTVGPENWAKAAVDWRLITVKLAFMKQ